MHDKAMKKTHPLTPATVMDISSHPDNENPKYPPRNVSDARAQLLILNAKEAHLKSAILAKPCKYQKYYTLTVSYNMVRRKKKQLLTYAKAQNWF
jgi:hypothetical protein